ncbi:LolA-related protein [Lysobacter sp. D1-1-M9]|uniref:LolA-related protein n=1 Tax=Novilysobacter longmucuonensis TaxID=3098603 RepID=UPI002FC98AC8
MTRISKPTAQRLPTCATLLALLALTALPLHAAPPEPAPPSAAATQAQRSTPGDIAPEWILVRLERPVPIRTEFVELRSSELLKAPLRVNGEYRRPDAQTLVRVVREPYLETTTIGQGEVSIVRDGRSPRRFSLSRAPQLAALHDSFGALLSGDRARLEQHYRIASTGSRERWVLRLTPKDAELAEQLVDIALYGRGAELRCIETRTRGRGGGRGAGDGVDPDIERTLLAGAARRAGTAPDHALVALCHGDSVGSQ